MPTTIRKGEIFDVADGEDGHPYRVLIVSDEGWNDGVAPQTVEIVRPHGAREIPPYMLLTTEADSVQTGLLVMDSLSPVDPADLIEPIGSVGSSTLSRVDAALRMVFSL